MNMKKTLKENIKENYAELKLSPEQWRSLDSLQQNRAGKHGVRFFLKISFAAMAASVLLLSLYLFQGSGSLVERIADEVAYNHNKNVQMEIKTASIDEVQSFLSKIDFTLIHSERLPLEQWELLGGRYCSIQGRLAVQMKIRNKADGKLKTLYQVPYPKELSHIKSVSMETYASEVKVSLWRERGMLLGLAGG
jgi:hypothetical protein